MSDELHPGKVAAFVVAFVLLLIASLDPESWIAGVVTTLFAMVLFVCVIVIVYRVFRWGLIALLRR